MAEEYRKLMVPSVIGVAFFVFGFFVTAHALDMSLRDIAIGLMAGAAGGVTMLIAVLHQNRLNTWSERMKLASINRQ